MNDHDLDNDLSLLSINLRTQNEILWNHEELIGVVHSPKGNIWNTLGVLRSDKAFVTSEEALYLLEFYGYKLYESTKLSENIQELNCINRIIKCIVGENGISSFKLFKTLKKHGYILFRPSCKYFPTVCLFEKPRGEYSLFKPSSTFKKSSPSGFIGHVFEIKSEDKIENILEKIEKISCKSILALPDEYGGFLFVEASILLPSPNHYESNSSLSKQLKSRKTI